MIDLWRLPYPLGLDDGVRSSIESYWVRLQTALDAADNVLVIESAKELVEAVCRAILDACDEPAPASGVGFSALVTQAHDALERSASRPSGTEPLVRTAARSARSMVNEIPELRNRVGGHGRLLQADLADELVHMVVDAAALWVRWALRRLGVLITHLALLYELRYGIFTRGKLSKLLEESELQRLGSTRVRAVGRAVGQRGGVGGTVNVAWEGIDSCIDGEKASWPLDYRLGLVEGLLFNREGELEPSYVRAPMIPRLFRSEDQPAAFITELTAEVVRAASSRSYLNLEQNSDFISAMRASTSAFGAGDARSRWAELVTALITPSQAEI